MASPQGYDKLFTNAKIEMFDVDADYTTAAVVTATAMDMRDYEGYACLVMASTLTGSGITLVEIVAGSDSGVTADIISIKSSGAVVGDAVGDYVVLECSASEIAQEAADNGSTARYAAVRLTMDNAGDEAVATIIRHGGICQDGLTATTIA